jgi:putative endonuclease
MRPSPARRQNSPRRDHGARIRAERVGRRAEAFAAWLLRLKGYTILEERFKTPVGELDLVVGRGRTIVFVEVKARTMRDAELEALLAVDQRRVTRAAEYYLARHPDLAQSQMRFDVIFLAPRMWPRHVKNAFPAA